jgi:type I restriction enzyme S subunit
LDPLSVFLDVGVVPRSERDDNHNQLGAHMSNYLVVRPGDIVFNKLRTWQGGLGVSRHGGIVSPAYFVCRPQEAIDPRYYHYLLRSSIYLAELTRLSKSMPPSQFDIAWDDLRSLSVLHPPLAEQQAIADYLDAETARIDSLIVKKQQLIHLLEERIAALLDTYFAPHANESTVRLARIATVQTGVTLNASKVNDGRTVRMPYLRVANVQPGRLDLSEVKEVEVEPAAASRSRLRAGDVLMTEGGDIDKLGRGTVWRGEIENCLHQNHVFAVRPRPGLLDSEFLGNVTRTSHARTYFESTGVQSTNLASTNSFKVADFRIPALDIEVQRARCESYERSALPLSEGSARLQHQIHLLAEHRQALITAAVTGDFVVPGAA